MRELRGLIPRQSQDPLAAPAVPQHTAGCAAPSWPAQLPMKPPIRYHLIAGVFCAYYEKKKKKKELLCSALSSFRRKFQVPKCWLTFWKSFLLRAQPGLKAGVICPSVLGTSGLPNVKHIWQEGDLLQWRCLSAAPHFHHTSAIF